MRVWRRQTPRFRCVRSCNCYRGKGRCSSFLWGCGLRVLKTSAFGYKVHDSSAIVALEPFTGDFRLANTAWVFQFSIVGFISCHFAKEYGDWLKAYPTSGTRLYDANSLESRSCENSTERKLLLTFSRFFDGDLYVGLLPKLSVWWDWVDFPVFYSVDEKTVHFLRLGGHASEDLCSSFSLRWSSLWHLVTSKILYNFCVSDVW